MFPCQDGRSLIVHLSSPPKFWENLCLAVGRSDLPADPRFAERKGRQRNYELLRAELSSAFITRDREEWLDLLQDHQVPCAPVNTVGEALEDEQLRHLGLFHALEDPEIGLLPRIRPPVHWDGAPLDAVARAPQLGEHTAEVLAEVSVVR